MYDSFYDDGDDAVETAEGAYETHCEELEALTPGSPTDATVVQACGYDDPDDFSTSQLAGVGTAPPDGYDAADELGATPAAGGANTDAASAGGQVDGYDAADELGATNTAGASTVSAPGQVDGYDAVDDVATLSGEAVAAGGAGVGAGAGAAGYDDGSDLASGYDDGSDLATRMPAIGAVSGAGGTATAGAPATPNTPADAPRASSPEVHATLVPPFDASKGVHEFNARLQAAVSMPGVTPEQRLARVRSVRKLVRWFVAQAHHDVHAIVSELSLPAARKTVKSVDAGGVAGGEKFLNKLGIFYKRYADAAATPTLLSLTRVLVLQGCRYQARGWNLWRR